MYDNMDLLTATTEESDATDRPRYAQKRNENKQEVRKRAI